MMQPAMIPESMLEERRRLGHDRFDEVWEGVLHMVPFPSPFHQRAEGNLYVPLKVIAARRGLEAFTNIGLYDPKIPGHTSYRGPDVAIVESRDVSERGIEGRAHLVVEILSPDDESHDKLPFYARVGVREVWLLDAKARTIEVFAGETPVAARADGRIAAPSLALEVWIDGATLKLRDGADMYDVALG